MKVLILGGESTLPQPLPGSREVTGEEEDLHQPSSRPDLQEEHEGRLLPCGPELSQGLLCC